MQARPRDAAPRCQLTPGDVARVPANVPHLVANRGRARCRYILIQGIGPYDFVPADD